MAVEQWFLMFLTVLLGGGKKNSKGRVMKERPDHWHCASPLCLACKGQCTWEALTAQAREGGFCEMETFLGQK